MSMPQWIKSTFNFIKPLFCEDDKLSIGRVGLWVCLSKIWTIVEISTLNTVTDIPANMLILTMVFVAYNFSKKKALFIDLIKAIWPNGKR